MNYRTCKCGSGLHGYDSIRGTCTECVQRASHEAQQKLLRQEVYQEGQRAYSSGATCPYTDWRQGTWHKGNQAAREWHADVRAEYRKPPPQEMKSAGWTIRRAGTYIEIEDLDGSGTGISRDQGDVFLYFNDLLKENNL